MQGKQLSTLHLKWQPLTSIAIHMKCIFAFLSNNHRIKVVTKAIFCIAYTIYFWQYKGSV